MRIGGLQRCSLIDYPGKLSCVVFTQGCNFRCPYCHNRELVVPQYFTRPIPPTEVLQFLDKRRRYLDGVVVSGGEPTEHRGLIRFIDTVKKMGYLVKLDTNGSRPHVIRRIIRRRLVDFIAMDVKSSPEKYSKAIGVDFPFEKIKESIDLIKNSGIAHEFRTTVVRPMCGFEDICKISSLLKGAQAYRLQEFRASAKMVNQNILKFRQPSGKEIETWKETIAAAA